MAQTHVAVIGAGAFGRNHLRVYHELEQADPGRLHLVAVADSDPQAREAAAAQFGISAYATVEELLHAHPGLHAASIAVPTTSHAAVACELLRAGVDVLIEKPFAPTLAEADQVLALAASLGRLVGIAHLERFNPAVTAASQLLTRPMFFEAHRLSVFTPRSLDVDVVLDLMIHDLDIVLALAGSPVREVRGVGLPVLSHKVDIANVRVEFESGCIANFTASRVSTEQVRKLRLFQPQQYISLDFARQELFAVNVSEEASRATRSMMDRLPALPDPQVSPDPQHPSAGLLFQKTAVDKAEPLRLELQDFIRAVQEQTPPRVTGHAGRNALALALQANEEIARHASRAGLA